MKEKEGIGIPSLEVVEAERDRIRYNSRYHSALRSTLIVLIVVAALAVLIATLWLPFLRIYGTSMTPTLEDGEVVVCLKTSHFKQGDIVAFYFNNKILVKRVIAMSGDWVDIKEDGTTFVNDVEIKEPYLNEKAYGDGDVTYPYQVPDNAVFVMGDHRETSVDSRYSTIGCVSNEFIVGKMLIRIWPLSQLEVFG